MVFRLSQVIAASCSLAKPYILRALEPLFLKHEWTTQNHQTLEASCQHESKKPRNIPKQSHKEAMIIQPAEEQRNSIIYLFMK